jgi:hypothetical protein
VPQYGSRGLQRGALLLQLLSRAGTVGVWKAGLGPTILRGFRMLNHAVQQTKRRAEAGPAAARRPRQAPSRPRTRLAPRVAAAHSRELRACRTRGKAAGPARATAQGQRHARHGPRDTRACCAQVAAAAWLRTTVASPNPLQRQEGSSKAPAAAHRAANCAAAATRGKLATACVHRHPAVAGSAALSPGMRRAAPRCGETT